MVAQSTGTSAGGILISRAVTERPDLFAAAVCNVGDANAMRLEFRPNGPGNIPEFGTVMDPVECAALYEMDGVDETLAREAFKLASAKLPIATTFVIRQVGT